MRMSNRYVILRSKKLGISVAIFLIAILFFNIFGYFIYFNFLQNNIRKEISSRMRQGMHDSELSIIEVNSRNLSELQWIKPNKEFRFRGCLYDLVKTAQKDGKEFLYCINDTRESKLISDFAKNTESNQRAKKLLSNFISANYISCETNFSPVDICNIYHFSISHFNILLNIREINDPPPKLL
jgi:hypothetical protein